MIAALIALNITAGLFLIGVVLLQSGKGADMGAAFGGSSTTVFGASGAGNLLTKITAGTAAVFMTTSLLLAVLSSRDQSVFADAPEPEAAIPATPPAPVDGLPVDPNAAAEARGQEPIVNDGGAPGGGPASSDSANDLGPAGAAGGEPAASDTAATGKDLLGNPVQPMQGDVPRTGEAVPAPTGSATAPAGEAVGNATGGTPTNPTAPSNPTGATPPNPTGSAPAGAAGATGAPAGTH